MSETVESIAESNWEKRARNGLAFFEYFVNLKRSFDNYKNRDAALANIDAAEFKRHVEALVRVQADRRTRILWASSNPEDWVPSRVLDAFTWVKGRRDDIYCLGHTLARAGRTDLLPILAIIDTNAKATKDRHKLPAGLVGKNIIYEQVDDTTWTVRVIPRDDRCFYERVAQEENE